MSAEKSNKYSSPFFTIPSRIMNIPGITIQLLRFYEKIFQYWHHDHECFIGNDALMEHCGMKSESTISKAFQFFEKAGEIKREIRDGHRYITQPPRSIKIGKEKNNKLSTTPLATARGNPRASETPPLAAARHNKKNNNNKNLNKSSCASRPKSENQKPEQNWLNLKQNNERRHEWAESKQRASETKQTARFWGEGHPDYDRLNQ